MLNRRLIITINALLMALILSANAYCSENESKIGITIEEGKYERKRLFYTKNGKKLELKVKGEHFVDPLRFKKTGDGRFILFIDSLEDNKFDTNIYIYDILRNKTAALLMRNVKKEYIRQIEWFDTHSFLINVLAGDYYNFTIANFGPFYNGSYLVKFGEDFQIERMNKIEW